MSESSLYRGNGNIPQSLTVQKQGRGETIDTAVYGLYEQRAIIRSGDLTFDSDDFDMKFTIPFDDDCEANEAELILYNLSYDTSNRLRLGQTITVIAGYGTDLAVIFSGRISSKKVKSERTDRVITIAAIDDAGLTEMDYEYEFPEGSTASGILEHLVAVMGVPLVKFAVVRDQTYDRAVTVSGSILDNIQKYANICGASAYFSGGSFFVAPIIGSVTNGALVDLSVETGLIQADEYEKQETNGNYTDTIRGFTLEMLLDNRLRTGTYINLNSRQAVGRYYVQSGSHTFDGKKMITKVVAIK